MSEDTLTDETTICDPEADTQPLPMDLPEDGSLGEPVISADAYAKLLAKCFIDSVPPGDAARFRAFGKLEGELSEYPIQNTAEIRKALAVARRFLDTMESHMLAVEAAAPKTGDDVLAVLQTFPQITAEEALGGLRSNDGMFALNLLSDWMADLTEFATDADRFNRTEEIASKP